jgi:hypothetical protein
VEFAWRLRRVRWSPRGDVVGCAEARWQEICGACCTIGPATGDESRCLLPWPHGFERTTWGSSPSRCVHSLGSPRQRAVTQSDCAVGGSHRTRARPVRTRQSNPLSERLAGTRRSMRHGHTRLAARRPRGAPRGSRGRRAVVELLTGRAREACSRAASSREARPDQSSRTCHPDFALLLPCCIRSVCAS